MFSQAGPRTTSLCLLFDCELVLAATSFYSLSVNSFCGMFHMFHFHFSVKYVLFSEATAVSVMFVEVAIA